MFTNTSSSFYFFFIIIFFLMNEKRVEGGDLSSQTHYIIFELDLFDNRD